MSGRFQHVDVARGLGALLVVFGHNWVVVGEQGELFAVVFSFHIPLFFFLSGLFFRTSDDVAEAAGSRTRSLLKPYLVTFALLAVDDVLLATDGDPLRYFGGVAYGVGRTIPWAPLWFLPHLWVLSLLALVVTRTTRFASWPTWAKTITIFAMLGLGVLAVETFWEKPVRVGNHEFVLPGLPLSLDVLLISGAYFLSGHLFRDRVLVDDLAAPIGSRRRSLERWGFVIALSTFTGVHWATDATMDINWRRYDHLVFSTLAATSGIYLTIVISKYLTRLPTLSRVLSYVGTASLFVLIFHFVVQNKVFALVTTHLPDRPHAAAFVAFLVACVVPLGIFEVVKRVRLLRAMYLP